MIGHTAYGERLEYVTTIRSFLADTEHLPMQIIDNYYYLIIYIYI